MYFVPCVRAGPSATTRFYCFFFLWLCLLARMDLGKRLFTPAWGPSSASATWRGHDATCPGPASPSHLRRGGGRRKPLTEPETEEAPRRDFNALSPAAKKKKDVGRLNGISTHRGLLRRDIQMHRATDPAELGGTRRAGVPSNEAHKTKKTASDSQRRPRRQETEHAKSAISSTRTNERTTRERERESEHEIERSSVRSAANPQAALVAFFFFFSNRIA